MDTLNRVMQLQQQGLSDNQISDQLKKEGMQPQQITDALGQAKVKSAITQPESNPSYQPDMDNMQQSIMQQPSQNQQSFQAQEQTQMQPQEQSSQYYPEQPQAYSQEAYYPQQQGYDTDTITEIAEQVVEEKFSEFTRKTGDLSSFKNQIQDEIADLNHRLQRIENSIDKLQQAVIGKIGEFGDATASIHKDLDNLHQTMGKLANPLIDNYKALKKIAGKK